MKYVLKMQTSLSAHSSEYTLQLRLWKKWFCDSIVVVALWHFLLKTSTCKINQFSSIWVGLQINAVSNTVSLSLLMLQGGGAATENWRLSWQWNLRGNWSCAWKEKCYVQCVLIMYWLIIAFINTQSPCRLYNKLSHYWQILISNTAQPTRTRSSIAVGRERGKDGKESVCETEVVLVCELRLWVSRFMVEISDCSPSPPPLKKNWKKITKNQQPELTCSFLLYAYIN